MKKYILLSLVAILATSCHAQEKNNLESKQENKEKELTQTKPKGSWRVNKEVDEHGNLIRYDSIYSWSSSSDGPNTIGKHNIDSLNQMFSSIYKRFGTISGNQTLPDFFNNDSLFEKDFFQNDFFDEEFFHNRFNDDFSDWKKMRKHMDSLQKEFLEKYNFQVVPLENEGNDKKNRSHAISTQKV